MTAKLLGGHREACNFCDSSDGTELAWRSADGPNFSHIHTLDILRDGFRLLDS